MKNIIIISFLLFLTNIFYAQKADSLLPKQNFSRIIQSPAKIDTMRILMESVDKLKTELKDLRDKHINAGFQMDMYVYNLCAAIGCSVLGGVFYGVSLVKESENDVNRNNYRDISSVCFVASAGFEICAIVHWLKAKKTHYKYNTKLRSNIEYIYYLC